jgi:hypothetical protein
MCGRRAPAGTHASLLPETAEVKNAEDGNHA